MDLKELKELLEIISERDITEFELEEEGVKLKIKKGSALVTTVETNNHHAVPNSPASLAASAPVVAAPAPLVQPPTGGNGVFSEPGVVQVRSPMVGTFYRAPDPNAPPFVNVGDHVKVGQVLCIIEAMKLMNEIESEQAGEIVRVVAENGQPVQYGDELFSVRVSA